jgi:hypothetical protein
MSRPSQTSDLLHPTPKAELKHACTRKLAVGSRPVSVAQAASPASPDARGSHVCSKHAAALEMARHASGTTLRQARVRFLRCHLVAGSEKQGRWRHGVTGVPPAGAQRRPQTWGLSGACRPQNRAPTGYTAALIGRRRAPAPHPSKPEVPGLRVADALCANGGHSYVLRARLDLHDRLHNVQGPGVALQHTP